MNLTSTASEEFNPAVVTHLLADLGCAHELRVVREVDIDSLHDTILVLHEGHRYEFHVEPNVAIPKALVARMADAILNQGSHYWATRYPHEVIEALHGSDT